MTLISVIIPIYNQARVLRRSLQSLARQTYRPLETIIVNDGSTDNFPELIDDIIKCPQFIDLHIKVINQSRQGAPAARNHGFSESSGQYLIFWDADTVARAKMLSTMFTALQLNPVADWAYAQFYFGWKKMRGRVFDPVLLKKNNYIDVSSLLRRQAFVPFDERLKRFQDWDLWLTLSAQGKKGIFISRVLYKKIVNPSGISTWQPSFFFKLPWQSKKIKIINAAMDIIRAKHNH